MTATRTAYRDAVGWLYAHARGDWEARDTLAQLTDPVALVDALTHLLLGLARISTHDEPLLYIDYLRDHLDELCAAAGIEDDE